MFDPTGEHRWTIRPTVRGLILLCDGREITVRPRYHTDSLPALIGIAATLGAGGYDQ